MDIEISNDNNDVRVEIENTCQKKFLSDINWN
jgi:hypothetical protein